MNDRRLLRTVPCRYGRMTVPVFDTTIGKSLEFYGEWGQQEIDLLSPLLPVGGTVADIGAYVGSHTLALARRVGRRGEVLACEPRSAIFGLLQENVSRSACGNVRLFQGAVGRARGRLSFPKVDLESSCNFGKGVGREETAARVGGGEAAESGESVAVKALDDLELDRLDLVKIDVEGMEADVLIGGEATLERHRPLIYLECSSLEHGRVLLDLLSRRSYRAYCHRPTAFNPANFNGCDRSIFGLEREAALVAVPREHPSLDDAWARSMSLEAVADLDQLGRALGEGAGSPSPPPVAAHGEAGGAIDAINGHSLAALPVDPQGRRRIALESVGLLVTGWAVAEGESAARVLVRIGDETFESDFGFPRGDLARRRRDGRFLRSGFACALPKWALSKGPLRLEIEAFPSGRARSFEVEAVELVLV